MKERTKQALNLLSLAHGPVNLQVASRRIQVDGKRTPVTLQHEAIVFGLSQRTVMVRGALGVCGSEKYGCVAVGIKSHRDIQTRRRSRSSGSLSTPMASGAAPCAGSACINQTKNTSAPPTLGLRVGREDIVAGPLGPVRAMHRWVVMTLFGHIRHISEGNQYLR
jgi:hypothetical protein